MRLNIFSRFKRRRKDGKRGAIGRVVDAVFPSWSAAPARPVVQLLALGLFAFLLFYVGSPGGGETAHAQAREGREWLPAETMLSLDPLVGVSNSIATGALHGSLLWAGVVLAGCLIVPRWFCGYVCPMGTVIDITDWALWRWLPKPKLRRRGWMQAKYAVLPAVIGAAILGVQLSGFASPLPILTRGVAAVAGGGGGGRWLAIGLPAAILLLGLIAPRFWCRHLCPSGALQSLAGALSLTKRKVESSCIECGRCAAACSFDAIGDDFTTRHLDCTFCQVCGGVCPVGAIHFTGRRERRDEKTKAAAPDAKTSRSRRGFLAATVSGVGLLAGGGIAAGLRPIFGAKLPPEGGPLPIRPPGALREKQFLAACVRCGACMKACPTQILQPTGAGRGFEDLWTPHADCNVGACAKDCNNCGQVCPTGAIRPLPPAVKQKTKMGLARVNEQTCIACYACLDACPYGAISDPLTLGEEGQLPIVDATLCVGCGTCQYTCYQTNVVQAEEKLRDGRAAIRVFALERG